MASLNMPRSASVSTRRPHEGRRTLSRTGLAFPKRRFGLGGLERKISGLPELDELGERTLVLGFGGGGFGAGVLDELDELGFVKASSS